MHIWIEIKEGDIINFINYFKQKVIVSKEYHFAIVTNIMLKSRLFTRTFTITISTAVNPETVKSQHIKCIGTPKYHVGELIVVEMYKNKAKIRHKVNPNDINPKILFLLHNTYHMMHATGRKSSRKAL